MARWAASLALVSIACASDSISGNEGGASALRQDPPEPPRYVLRAVRPISDEPALASALNAVGATDVHPLLGALNAGRTDVFGRTYTFSADTDPEALRTDLLAAGAEWVERDTLSALAGKKGDPWRTLQWNLDDLDIETAWTVTDGSGVTVAVVDSGFRRGGDDEPASVLDGYDFVDADWDPTDEDGHGTHVAGTIAQATHNGVGVAGVAPGVDVLPLRVVRGDGTAWDSDIAAAIVYAADEGAQVVNISLAGPSPNVVTEEACDYATAAGALVVSATGNDATTNTVYYPAAYDSVVAVGAVDLDRNTTTYSNWGAEVDLVAPGGDVYADLDGNGYEDGILQETFWQGVFGFEFWDGTSMAAPHVSGVAALLFASGLTDPDEVRQRMEDNALDLGAAGWDKKYGHGLVDPVAALNAGAAPVVGLYLTELMVNPNVAEDRHAEWVELYNAGTNAADLSGMTFANVAGTTVALPAISVPAGAFVVLGRGRKSDWADPDLVPDAHYGRRLGLDNQGERLALLDASGGEIAAVTLDVTQIKSGKSVVLDADVYLSGIGSPEDPASWSIATESYGSQLGTPGW